MKQSIMLPSYAKAFQPEDEPAPVDLSFINIAYRPKPVGAATGGPNGVLALQQLLLGNMYRGFYLRYHFEPQNFKMPELWAKWISEQKLATMSKGLMAAHHFVQNSLSEFLPKDFSTRPGAIYHFVCHDIGSAAAAHLCGFPFTLIYHQQGSFIHERTSFGETLNPTERHVMNVFEKIAFEEADRVYFPSHGARKAFESTTGSVDISRVRFADNSLYNTVVDFDVSIDQAKLFLAEHGLEYLLDHSQRQKYLLFVSVGDYTKNKGIDRCPEILSKIAERTDKKIIWICMGSKHKAGIYEKLLAEKDNYPFTAILVPKRQPHDLAMGIVSHADWLLMLQRHSIFDFSTLETMKLGKGVVLSPVGGNLEFNKNANIVYVDPEKNIEESVANLVNSSSEEYGAKNKKVFDRYFSPDCFKKSYLEMYNDIIERTLKPTFTPAFEKNDSKKIKSLLGKKEILICGPGASLNELSKEQINGKVVIALNSALLVDIPFDIHFMQDEPKNPEYWDVYLQKNVARIYGQINRLSTKGLQIDFSMLERRGIDYATFQLSPIAFDVSYENLDFNLDANPVQDLLGILFSTLQVCAWAGVSSIELAGIDFSAENYDGKNPNKYNRNTFQNLASMVHGLDRFGTPISVLHTSSEIINKIVENKGEVDFNDYLTPPAQNKTFEERLRSYDPIRRTVVRLGDRWLPKKIAKYADQLLQKTGIL